MSIYCDINVLEQISIVVDHFLDSCAWIKKEKVTMNSINKKYKNVFNTLLKLC